MSKYRIDQFRELQEATERMQKAWDDAGPAVRPAEHRDVIERTGGRGLHDPLPHRQNISKALDRNLEVGGMQPHLAKHLARSADGKNKVVPPLVKSEPRADDWMFPPADGASQRARAKAQRRAERWRKRRGDGEPSPDERSETFEEGVDYIEETALPAFEDPTTTGAVEQARGATRRALDDDPTDVDAHPYAASDTLSQLDDASTAAQTPPPPEDKPTRDGTQTGFAYVPGSSAYDDWLREHSDGAEIVSGEGTHYVDHEATRTQHARKKPTR